MNIILTTEQRKIAEKLNCSRSDTYLKIKYAKQEFNNKILKTWKDNKQWYTQEKSSKT